MILTIFFILQNIESIMYGVCVHHFKLNILKHLSPDSTIIRRSLPLIHSFVEPAQDLFSQK